MAQSFNAALYGNRDQIGGLRTHWRARGVESCILDLALKPTENATATRVDSRQANGQSLAGTGALVFEGEIVSTRR